MWSGSSIPKGKEKRHYDTKKHQNYLNNKSMVDEARKLYYTYYEPGDSVEKNNLENNIMK